MSSRGTRSTKNGKRQPKSGLPAKNAPSGKKNDLSRRLKEKKFMAAGKAKLAATSLKRVENTETNPGKVKSAMMVAEAPVTSAAKSLEAVLNSERSLKWIHDHRAKYVGLWVALDAGKLIAKGENAVEVYKKAKEKGVTIPFVHFVAEPEPANFVGGWS